MPRTLKWGATARLHRRLPLAFFERLDRAVEVTGGEPQEVLLAAVHLHGREDMHAQALAAQMELERLQDAYNAHVKEAYAERQRLQKVQESLTRKLGRYAKLAGVARGRMNRQQLEAYIERVEGLKDQSRDVEEQLARLAEAVPELAQSRRRSSASEEARMAQRVKARRSRTGLTPAQVAERGQGQVVA